MNRPIHLLLSFCVLLLGTQFAGAADQAELKARMSQRLPAIVALAKRGAIGENNRAQLTPRGKLTAAERAIVDAENADRLAVYALIAKKTGTSPATVARQRAAQIRSAAIKGTWIQMTDGSWRQAGG